MPPFLLNSGQASSITSLLGLALILALPEIVKKSKENLVSDSGFGGLIFKAATESAKTGWKGGEVIPGFAASNTSNLPYVGKYIGSGKNAVRSGAMRAEGLLGGVASGVREKYFSRGGDFRSGYYDGYDKSVARAGTRYDDKHYNNKIRQDARDKVDSDGDKAKKDAEDKAKKDAKA
jgi:hypothetical protein